MQKYLSSLTSFELFAELKAIKSTEMKQIHLLRYMHLKHI